MRKFLNTDIQEQETLIHVDFFSRLITLYTSSELAYNRYLEKLGEPSKIYYTKNKISGASWIVSFDDGVKSRCVFSKPTALGRNK